MKVQQLLDQLQWHDQLQWIPASDSTPTSCIAVLLNLAGCEFVKAQGSSALNEQYVNAIPESSETASQPQLKFLQPPALHARKLPEEPQFEAIRYWHDEPERQVFLLEVKEDWRVFSGHFPGRPILPGIMQLHWVAGFAHHFMHKADQPSEVRQLKFHNVFVPSGWLEIELSEQPRAQLGFRLSSVAGVHAQGRLLYEE